MAARGYQNNDLRRQVGSPKAKGRVDHKDTLCRNILIYGHCRYENTGCTFNHDQNKGSTNASNISNSNSTTANNAASEMSKKAFNVESPSFTPSNISKKPTFSSQALSAAPFTPRGNTSGSSTSTPIQHNGDHSSFVSNPAAVPEFTPQNYGLSSTATTTPTGQDATLNYDAFAMSAVGQALPTAPYNPYADDHNAAAVAAAAAMGAANPAFFQQNAFATHTQPLMHHLYFPAGPHKEDLTPYQRTSHDFFVSERLRQDLQKKSEAALQVINTGLPQLDNFHSLVALDTTNRKNANTFGYPSWVYKAVDGKTGFIRCLRRLEGFRLSNEHAIRSVKEWRRIDCGSVVSVFDAFTTRAFGDSSIVFVQEYFPLSKTLMELHFPNQAAAPGTRYKQQTLIPENTLWAYITQIATALKTIHAANLAARCVDLSKIICTDKNRIRLGACAILDVAQFEARRPVQDLQQEDLLQFGRVILSLASLTPPALLTNATAAMEHLGRNYSVELRDTVLWLLTPQQQQPKNIDEFVRGIATHFVTSFDQALHESDSLRSELSTSLESDRIARLLMKLAIVNERPDFNGDTEWSENGDRYTLKLFRDYVFHQVDANGHPIVDLGHMISCMNKLDAGTDERVCLTSRDEQTVFVVTYRTLREQLRSLFAEISRAAKGRGGL
ncbi:related to poly(A)-specific ribonuclease [Cephalotrichum gorgonifer]|uniref:PAN2-PAN3 deadenylation complex subunit PAN3 n=1 Tax=Cephalotrichum gorgonifer TaxID=2041049 RepID=A0AAE8SWL8_9PEZI|nr:related to poly(A)-specific ribonuclease [Cephalotrichum gorgonifer]